ncbi:hypothetical protein LZ554_008686 [Drepanopeziza brunnea f. sp. 'monogermtubi']|nr:hypothetical protein LZ554_008686 [Drepanopeziza brunnea f. sp. 'monogermtubi']
MFRSLIGLAAVSAVLACPQDNSNVRVAGLQKRADEAAASPWTYEGARTWGNTAVNGSETCQTGMTQSPINLPWEQYSRVHIPTLNYTTVSGTVSNWGYGIQFMLNKTNGQDYTGNPTLRDGENVYYLHSFHTHTPSEHRINGERSHGELHLVHADAEGKPKGVLGLRINPSENESPFLAQVLGCPGVDSTAVKYMESVNMVQALEEVDHVRKFWTYKGSLTTPPCGEGLRWWVAEDVMQVSDAQMQSLLGVSLYSSRIEQSVWRHDVNQM